VEGAAKGGKDLVECGCGEESIRGDMGCRLSGKVSIGLRLCEIWRRSVGKGGVSDIWRVLVQ